MPDITKTLQRATPFIQPLSTSGGTFYTFSSAAEDLTLSFNTDTNRKFRFSKFALLNIPDFRTENPILNTVRLKAVPGAYQYVDFNRTTKLNHFFSESFQNYCLNLETMILSSENYNPRNSRTVSERVFFKWLKELGAIRFNQETVPGINDIRYFEEDEVNGQYNRVVQYIGNIDFTNNLSTQVNSFSEVYVHIPVEVGNFPKVYFRSIDDENYSPGLTFARLTDGINNEFISGRISSDFNPAGLDIHAFFDNDIGLPSSQNEVMGRIYTQWKKKTTAEDFVIPEDYQVNDWWYTPTNDTNSYYLEPGQFEDIENDDLAISTGGDPNPDMTAIKFRRSRLDGISIDFDVESYKSFDESNNVTSLLNVAQSIQSKNFEFNAILVYYDLYEEQNIESNVSDVDDSLFFVPTPDEGPFNEAITTNTLSTNLFGVLFLDNVEDNLSISGGFIPRSKKIRPNTITKLNGNAYSFKLNLKLDVSPINSGIQVETIVSTSNTLSMDIFADTLNAFRISAEKMQDLVFNSLTIDTKISKIESLIKNFDLNTINSILNRLLSLETTLNSSTNISNVTNTNDLLPLIDRNYQLILDILNGKLPINVSYDLGQFVEGIGISMNRTNPNRLIISSTNDNYNFQDKIECSVYKDWNLVPHYLKGTKVAYTYEVKLKPLKNYIRITDNTGFIPNKDMILYIRDEDISWSIGQTFRIYFKNPIMMRNYSGNFDFYIYTDYLNLSKAQDKYNALISKISSTEFESKNYRPVIEIICKEPGHFDFFIDYLN